MATQNTNNVNALNAGTVFCTLAQANELNWTGNKSQPCYPMKNGKFQYSNRAAFERDGDWYVRAKSGKAVQVRKIDENRYEVI